jgi:hypothetical protein
MYEKGKLLFAVRGHCQIHLCSTMALPTTMGNVAILHPPAVPIKQSALQVDLPLEIRKDEADVPTSRLVLPSTLLTHAAVKEGLFGILSQPLGALPPAHVAIPVKKQQMHALGSQALWTVKGVMKSALSALSSGARETSILDNTLAPPLVSSESDTSTTPAPPETMVSPESCLVLDRQCASSRQFGAQEAVRHPQHGRTMLDRVPSAGRASGSTASSTASHAQLSSFLGRCASSSCGSKDDPFSSPEAVDHESEQELVLPTAGCGTVDLSTRRPVRLRGLPGTACSLSSVDGPSASLSEQCGLGRKRPQTSPFACMALQPKESFFKRLSVSLRRFSAPRPSPKSLLRKRMPEKCEKGFLLAASAQGADTQSRREPESHMVTIAAGHFPHTPHTWSPGTHRRTRTVGGIGTRSRTLIERPCMSLEDRPPICSPPSGSLSPTWPTIAPRLRRSSTLQKKAATHRLIGDTGASELSTGGPALGDIRDSIDGGATSKRLEFVLPNQPQHNSSIRIQISMKDVLMAADSGRDQVSPRFGTERTIVICIQECHGLKVKGGELQPYVRLLYGQYILRTEAAQISSMGTANFNAVFTMAECQFVTGNAVTCEVLQSGNMCAPTTVDLPLHTCKPLASPAVLELAAACFQRQVLLAPQKQVVPCRSTKILGRCKISVSGLSAGNTHRFEMPLAGVNTGFLSVAVSVQSAQSESETVGKTVRELSSPLTRGLLEVCTSHGQNFLKRGTTLNEGPFKPFSCPGT